MNKEEKDAIEKLTNGEKITFFELIRKMKREGIERFIVTRPEYVYIILNLIEKLQKENEELKNKLLDTLEGQKVIKEETPKYIKENYISKDKIKEILEETEITDFNSLVEAFLKIKKLLESE